MIKTMKTDNGILGFGVSESIEEALSDFVKALLHDDDDETCEDELCNDERCNDTNACECDDDGEVIETSQIIENDHVVTVGYNDDTDVVVINYDTPSHPWAVASALLEAAAHMWPRKIPKDDELVEALQDLAAMGRDIGHDALETVQ